MKKKSIIIGIIVLFVAVISIYLLTRPKVLGNIDMKHTSSEPVTNSSSASFSGGAGDKIKFSFRSNIESGDLEINLYDSADNEVYKLDQGKELETFFELDQSGEYTLIADYKNFIGRFDVVVTEE